MRNATPKYTSTDTKAPDIKRTRQTLICTVSGDEINVIQNPIKVAKFDNRPIPSKILVSNLYAPFGKR